MKETKIHYGDMPDKNLLIQALFAEDANDPRSVNYERTLERPMISWGMLALNMIIVLIVSAAIFYIVKYWVTDSWVAIVATALFILGYCVVRLKRIAISAVQLYQRFAPDRIRNKCRFEPSCSQYMILAISQYGAFKGIYKGVQRLKRCNPDGGGFDWP